MQISGATRPAAHDAVRISRWFGRLGNNICQLANALRVAQSIHGKVLIPKHSSPLFQCLPNVIATEYECASEVPLNVFDHEFFYMSDVSKTFNLQPANDAKKQRLLQQYIGPHIRVAPAFEPPSQLYPENALVIHVRSGDLFASSRPHPGYWQPPKAWYLHIISEHAKRTGDDDVPIVIVTEKDMENPCISALQEHLSPKHSVHVQSRSAEEDFATLMRARFLVGSNGTFSLTAAYLSETLHTYYKPVWDNRKNLCSFTSTWANDSVTVHGQNAPGYANGPWKNTPEQRRLMLTYAFPQ